MWNFALLKTFNNNTTYLYKNLIIIYFLEFISDQDADPKIKPDKTETELDRKIARAARHNIGITIYIYSTTHFCIICECANLKKKLFL